MENNENKIFNEEDTVRLCEISAVVNSKITDKGKYYEGDMEEAFNQLYIPILEDWKESDEPYVTEFANQKIDYIIGRKSNMDNFSISSERDIKNLHAEELDANGPLTGKEFKEILNKENEIGHDYIVINKEDSNYTSRILTNKGINHEVYNNAINLYCDEESKFIATQIMDESISDDAKIMVSPVTFLDKTSELFKKELSDGEFINQYNSNISEGLYDLIN